MDVTQAVRLLTFAAALLLGLIIVKVTVMRQRDPGDLDTLNPRTTYPALASYALLVFYVAAAQTAHNFTSPLTWRVVVGQAGVLLGAYAGSRDYIRIDLPARRARRARQRREQHR